MQRFRSGTAIQNRAIATVAIALVCMLSLLAGCSRHDSDESASTTTTASAEPAQLTDAEVKYGVSPTRNKDVTYQDDVIVMEHGAEAVRSISSNGLTYTIDANAPGAKDIQQDKILFATGRVVGRVLEVKRGGDGVAVTLGPVELTDIYKEAHISYHGTLDPDKMIVYQAPRDYPGTFTNLDAPDPNSVDPNAAAPPSAMVLPGKTGVTVGMLSSAGDSISLPGVPYGTRIPAWSDSDREHFRGDAALLVSRALGRADDGGCEGHTGALPILKTMPKKESGGGCGGGAPSIADILIDGAHFLPDMRKGLSVTASNTKGGMTFTTYATLRLDRPDFTFKLDITGGRLKTAAIELNLNGGLKVGFKGATSGEFTNFNKVTELPLDVSIPIPVAGPFAATFHQALLIQTVFTVKQGMIDINGDYALSGTIKAGIVNGKPAGSSDVSLTVNQGMADSLNGISLGVNGIVLGYSGKFIVGIGAYSFVVGPYASISTTVGATRGSDLATGLVSYTCRSAEFHMWMDYGVGVAVPGFVVKVLNGILSVFGSKHAISASYSTKLGTAKIKDIQEYIPASCAPKPG